MVAANGIFLAPALNLGDARYPLTPTHLPYYDKASCNHHYEHFAFEQRRRGDEAPTPIEKCTLCGNIR